MDLKDMSRDQKTDLILNALYRAKERDEAKQIEPLRLLSTHDGKPIENAYVTNKVNKKIEPLQLPSTA